MTPRPIGRWRVLALLGGFGRVEVDVDHVVEGADGDADGFAEFVVIEPSGSRWVSRMTEPRLQTAVSSAEVLSVISVQRLDEWMTPQWSCGLSGCCRGP
jgi:hypothetical protein